MDRQTQAVALQVPTARLSSGLYLLIFFALLTWFSQPALAQFVPPQKLDPGMGDPSLDPSYDREAWLVYTYEIDVTGEVVNAEIQSSNGILEVEQTILNQVIAQRYRPATRNGNPVKVFVGPVFYTWIVDKPRELSPEFDGTYQEAWSLFNEEDFDGAFELAGQLKDLPGRSAYEEVKLQVLAASLMSRFEDSAAELQHLERAVELQTLADRNGFRNRYIELSQYQLILERIHALQLERNMLADAAITMQKLISYGAGSEATERAKQKHIAADRAFRSNPDVTIDGELTPIYRGGPGAWEMRLSRSRFTLRNIRGKVDGVLLACSEGDMQLRFPSAEAWDVPMGWNNCTVEVSGRSGSRFRLHQLLSG